jgi:ABC-2 type transport system ATP-binding protein
VLNVENISKAFASIKAVNNISFSVAKGEIFGIVGPDGAGKSTLNRMLASISKPDKGRILLNHRDVFKNPYAIKEKIAYMPQRFGLYEDLTVEENLYFFGKLFGVPGRQIKQTLLELYAFSRLAPFKKRLAGRLSGGMKQKLGLACCLIHRPELIILDEPTNGVDPVSRREFWKILYDLLSQGVIIIVSTAYLDEAERCNALGLMYRGSFIMQGDPLRIKKETGRIMIEIVVDQARRAEKILKTHYPGVLLKGEVIKAFVKKPSQEKKRITSLLRAHNLEMKSWATGHPTLEDCFIDIISRRGSLQNDYS